MKLPSRVNDDLASVPGAKDNRHDGPTGLRPSSIGDLSVADKQSSIALIKSDEFGFTGLNRTGSTLRQQTDRH
jgi:hypothetical protein